MIIPTDDQSLFALTQHHDRLQNCALLACPSPETVLKVLDKTATLAAAERCGIRIPQTRIVSSSKQLLELSSTLAFPVVLKPAKKELTLEGVKSAVLNSAAEIKTRFESGEQFNPPMLLQEYCSGVGVGIELLMHQGNCLALFQHRRFKELPYTGGFSVSAEAAVPDPFLVQQSLNLLRALEWEGPAMVEFKVNADSSEAVLMEINGRYWGSISLPIQAGVDFPLYHWKLAHGETVNVGGDYPVGVPWRWTAGYVLRIHELIVAARRSKSARAELILSMKQLFSQPVGSAYDAVFSSEDPLPGILELLSTLRYLFVSDVRAARKRFGWIHRGSDKMFAPEPAERRL